LTPVIVPLSKVSAVRIELSVNVLGIIRGLASTTHTTRAEEERNEGNIERRKKEGRKASGTYSNHWA
jgi:hypothetical protein